MSNIVLATADDAEVLAPGSTDAATLSRAERKAADRAQRKAEKQHSRRLSGDSAVTLGMFPHLMSRAIGTTVMPRLDHIMGGMTEIVAETTAIVKVLEQKGILTQDEVDAERRIIEDDMKRMVEAAVTAAQNESKPHVNEQSPAFQEATEHAKGAPVKRLDEGRPSGIEVVGR